MKTVIRVAIAAVGVFLAVVGAGLALLWLSDLEAETVSVSGTDINTLLAGAVFLIAGLALLGVAMKWR